MAPIKSISISLSINDIEAWRFHQTISFSHQGVYFNNRRDILHDIDITSMLLLGGIPVKHDPSPCHYSYLIIYQHFSMEAQAGVSYCFISGRFLINPILNWYTDYSLNFHLPEPRCSSYPGITVTSTAFVSMQLEPSHVLESTWKNKTDFIVITTF